MRKYIVLAFVIVLVYFFQSFFLPAGGAGADSLSYFGIASDLPQLKTNLFPLGFPVLIKLFHSVFQDYFWTAKFLNISMVVVILVFSYFKKFYFKETVLLFTGKTAFFVFGYFISEAPFIFLLYFLFYVFHERFIGKFRQYQFVFFASLLLFLLFTIRYSGVYIYLGVGFFWLITILIKHSFPLKKDLFQVLLFAGIGIAGYLGFNLYIYGSFTGENVRGTLQQFSSVYLLRNILGVSAVFDPFIMIKPASNSFASLAFQIGLMIFDLLLLFYFIQLVRKKKEVIALDFHQLLWVVSGVYAVSLFVSYYFQQIEEMNVRMLAAANFCLFFSFLLIYFKNLKSDAFIFGLGSFFLFFLTVYALKTPVNYLNNKKQIESQMPQFSHKKYLYNDEKKAEVSLTTYHIPIIGKTFNYQHTNNQKGEIKQSIAGTINPQIKWLKYDTIKNKSQVLYTSELILK
ncbi:hypothetical protein EGH90_09390 [Kaistella haifensis]|nr:hypothetical protein EGH90_09390 [Kaistella haifensis]